MTNFHAVIPEEKLTEAYRLLLEMRDNCVKHADDQCDDPKREVKYEALNIAMAAMGRSIPPRWNSAKKFLPGAAVEGEVLVIVNGKYKNIEFQDAYMLAEFISGVGWIIQGFEEWEDPNVKYWVELPEPPKEE